MFPTFEGGTAVYAKYLETEVVYSINGLKVDVILKDVRHAFGRVDFLIEPKSGSGRIWVSKEALSPKL